MGSERSRRFRPLSWGLSFNEAEKGGYAQQISFRPLSWGLSFNIVVCRPLFHEGLEFSSPFLGTFFQSPDKPPFRKCGSCFRPLSWGLSFNTFSSPKQLKQRLSFSSPFLGTFFQ